MRLYSALMTAILLYIVSSSLPLNGQTLEEKRASLKGNETGLSEDLDAFLNKVNEQTLLIHKEIQHLYAQVLKLYESHANPQTYKDLLDQINQKRTYLHSLEEQWRKLSAQGNRVEGYGLWHAPETNLEQLIMDYGSQDYVYLIPPEVGEIRLSINSNLPIPRSSWNEMLELIMNQNGVGVKTLNVYLRELYLFAENHSNLKAVTSNRNDLEILPPNSRVGFLLSPEPSEMHRSLVPVLERLINPKTTSLQIIGRDILVISQVSEVQDFLKLYDFVGTNRGEKEYKLLPVSKLRADEMGTILETIFEHIDASGPPESRNQLGEANGLKVVVLQSMAQALFVVGTREEVKKAEEIIRNVEARISDARDRMVYTYVVRHSSAEELADILFRVYSLMISTGTGFDNYPPFIGYGGPGAMGTSPGGPGFMGAGQNGPGGPGGPQQGGPSVNGGGSDTNQNRVVVIDNSNGGGPQYPPPPLPSQKEPPILLYGQEGYYQEGGYVVNPAPAQPRIFTPTVANNDRDNFIVDLKTGSIVMVIEVDILPKIKELIRKLDVPKRMVQIETLLFEKVMARQNSFGLNLLRIGDVAANVNKTGAAFNNLFPVGSAKEVISNLGVFDFFLSRKETCSGIPAYDLIYRFLLNQEDVQINSCPSVMTVNQAPATISLTDDISINTGVFEVETAKGVTLKDAFTRAQYGTTISVRPTIHLNNCEDDDDRNYDYVTLETDVTFDTFNPGGDPQRPNISRRHITNLVQVADGETVILGGLRRKMSTDVGRAIPFLGELPGVGKLFSDLTLNDRTAEMFIFITPHIIKDSKEQLNALRQELLCLRPGDIPYFLECVEESYLYERNRLMEGSMTILFGRPRENYYILDTCPESNCGEYDGR